MTDDVMSMEEDVDGGGCRWRRMSMEEDVDRGGCQWRRMAMEEDGNGRGCMYTRHHSDNGHSEDDRIG